MYPHHYFGLFPPFARNNRVFVAMSFESQFNDRWKNVIAPAIRSVHFNDVPLEPHRVDTMRIGDSILTEILDGISNDQLVLADVTATDCIRDRPLRNANVMYEVGLAHALRPPDEVLLFRSDSRELLFDISNIRVNSYDPDNDSDDALQRVAGAIEDALRERTLKRHNAVKFAAKTVDVTSWAVLMNALASGSGNIQHFPTSNFRQAIANGPKNAAIRTLLGIGALEADFTKHSLDSIRAMSNDLEMFSYKLTPFGRALIGYINGETIDGSELWDELTPLVDVLAKHISPKGDDGP